MMRLDTARQEDCCLKCGSKISAEFRTVFGDDSGRAHRCYQCDIYQRVSFGSAADLEVSFPDPLENPGRFEGIISEKPPQVHELIGDHATTRGDRG